MTIEASSIASFTPADKNPGFFLKTRFLILDAEDAEFFWVEEMEADGDAPGTGAGSGYASRITH